MHRKGSITVYLSLMLLIIMSLFAAALHAGQSVGVRMQAAHAADMGIYSVFSRYDIPMLERYHLFFIDGTFGGGTLNMGSVYAMLKTDTSKVLENVKGVPYKNGLVDGLILKNGSITGYTLATDHGGNAVKSQAVDYMEAVFGVQSVRSLVEKVTEQEEVINELEKKDIEEHTIWNTYEAIPKEESLEPIEAVKEAKGRGVLHLVLSEQQNISDASLSYDQRVSARNREQGMGELSYDASCNSWKKELLFGEYLIRHFGSYTSSVSSDSLKYQLEYMIQGSSSDMENLKGVVMRLLAIREAANLQYLYGDSEKRAQVKSAAVLLAAACLNPEAAAVLEPVLYFCWAFGESVMDVRMLLAGGKIPLIKNQSSWKLNLSNLSEVFQNEQVIVDSGQEGMTYMEYLRILLLLKDPNQKLMRSLDMMEAGMRASSGNKAYRLDACIYDLDVSMHFQTDRGYGCDVFKTYGYQRK